MLGLGAGWNEAEFRAFGLPFERRVDRFEEAFGVIRRLLDGDRVSHRGRFHQVDDAVLLPRPKRRPHLMIGSTGPRVLSIALPHVDAWNTWYDLYGNTPEGFARENAKVTAALEAAGRDPQAVERSACVLVVLDRSAGERAAGQTAPALEGTPERIASGLRDLGEAGADEAILVVSPITERSIRQLGEVVARVS